MVFRIVLLLIYEIGQKLTTLEYLTIYFLIYPSLIYSFVVFICVCKFNYESVEFLRVPPTPPHHAQVVKTLDKVEGPSAAEALKQLVEADREPKVARDPG